MLRHTMRRNITSRRTKSQDMTLRSVTICYVTPCGAKSRHVAQVTKYNVAQRHDMLRHTMRRNITSRRTKSQNMTLHSVTICYVTPCGVAGVKPHGMFRVKHRKCFPNTCLLRHTYNALFFIHSPQLLYLYITFTTNHDLQRT